MKIKCISNKGEYPILVLPQDLCKTLTFDDYVYSKAPAVSVSFNVVEYSLSIGNEYTVFAMLFFSNLIWYLIFDDCGNPCFFPFQMFELSDNTIPWDWNMAYYAVEAELCVICGYEYISREYKHLVGLVAQYPQDLSELLNYKKHYDQWAVE